MCEMNITSGSNLESLATVIWRCVPSPQSNRRSSPSLSSAIELTPLLRVGSAAELPRTVTRNTSFQRLLYTDNLLVRDLCTYKSYTEICSSPPTSPGRSFPDVMMTMQPPFFRRLKACSNTALAKYGDLPPTRALALP